MLKNNPPSIYGRVILAIFLAVLFAGCSDTLITESDQILAKKGPPGGDPGDTFATITVFTDDPSHNIRSDDEVRSDPEYKGPEYGDGTCGVVSDLGNFNDARLDPDANYRNKDQKNCGNSRAIVFEWDDPVDGEDPKPTRVDGIFMNIDSVLTVNGTPQLHKGQFNVCNRLVFNPDDGSNPGNGSDLLLVTYDSVTDTWTVETRPAPLDKGFCVGDGRLWHMPFRLTISRPH